MTQFKEVFIGDIFEAENGKPKYIKDYIERHSGPYPVLSASTREMFGYVSSYDYEGHHLTWVMNGYGGRVQEVTGKFSANRDRGVFLPKKGIRIPDLTYLRFVMEPQLVAAAVGRRVDGRKNEYTKLYPEAALEVTISLPVASTGSWDYGKMVKLGSRLKRLETKQAEVKRVRDELTRASLSLDLPSPLKSFSLSDQNHFSLSIGNRVLTKDFVASGIPAYSANVLCPFGYVSSSNLNNFDRPSILWGIDGNFDWNYIPAGVEFATTDHCGRLQILNSRLDPFYVFQYLKATRSRYGFDRVFRASLKNVRTEVGVRVPVNEATGAPLLEAQKAIALRVDRLTSAQRKTLERLNALGEVNPSEIVL